MPAHRPRARTDLVGDMPVVAHGIVDLLQRLVETSGAHAALPGASYGDAYDQPTRP